MNRCFSLPFAFASVDLLKVALHINGAISYLRYSPVISSLYATHNLRLNVKTIESIQQTAWRRTIWMSTVNRSPYQRRWCEALCALSGHQVIGNAGTALPDDADRGLTSGRWMDKTRVRALIEDHESLLSIKSIPDELVRGFMYPPLWPLGHWDGWHSLVGRRQPMSDVQMMNGQTRVIFKIANFNLQWCYFSRLSF